MCGFACAHMHACGCKCLHLTIPMYTLCFFLAVEVLSSSWIALIKLNIYLKTKFTHHSRILDGFPWVQAHFAPFHISVLLCRGYIFMVGELSWLERGSNNAKVVGSISIQASVAFEAAIQLVKQSSMNSRVSGLVPGPSDHKTLNTECPKCSSLSTTIFP